MSGPTTPTGPGTDPRSIYATALAQQQQQQQQQSLASVGPDGSVAAGPGSASFDLDFRVFVHLLTEGRLHKDSQYHGVPLLHYAAFHARQDIVRELLARGALLTSMPGRNLSPLHFACNKDRRLCSEDEQLARANIVRMLVSNAVQLDVQESRGWTALKFAVRNGLVKCVEALLDCNANADLADEDGYSPLHNAVVVAKDMPDGEGFRMLQLLLRRVCDVNAVNDRRHTPLLLALLQRDRRSAEMLMHYGSDPNSMDADGNTPLILASQTGDDNLVSVFLARGAHVNLVSSCRQRTALHYAVEAGVSNIVRFLLRHGADVYIRDNMGDTPLSLASGNLLDLIRACAAVQAAESGDSDRLSELYRDGLDINAVHLASKSPLLHHAACAGQPDVVHFLLRSGAFVNEPNSEGNTALHYACVSELPHRNYAETLRQLLNSGADINARNDRGDTPLHLAAERGYNLRVSMLLKTAGAHQL
ncbi:putative ankyrin repeat protein RF_0381, partial [Sycon ciliatum]|uniref:putative ankyrin repeat protein RF_0381 n=1 Tax=Sycon ciliatum TaxID=27933 RepID=UPI0031F5FC11